MATPPKIPGLGAFVDKDPKSPKPVAPPLVLTASRLLVAAAIVQVIASVMAVIYAASPDRLAGIQAQIDTMSGNVPSLDAMRNIGILTVVLAGIATVTAYLLFAFFLHKGRSWARTATGILALLTVLQLVGISFPTGWTTVVQIVLGALAFGLCHLPVPKAYFAAMKAARS
ncbi:hypothetical protein AAGW05_15425 [Arthrobacter sp. LAPM80]|uniref:hypothetical protein n=1 Tax=Arthrobacter sp. LAPM80 TaxID=3141788 RepID=UPI00398AEFE7